MREPTPKRRRVETMMQQASKDWEANLAIAGKTEDVLQEMVPALRNVEALHEAQLEEAKGQLERARAHDQAQLKEAYESMAKLCEKRHAAQNALKTLPAAAAAAPARLNLEGDGEEGRATAVGSVFSALCAA